MTLGCPLYAYLLLDTFHLTLSDFMLKGAVYRSYYPNALLFCCLVDMHLFMIMFLDCSYLPG